MQLNKYGVQRAILNSWSSRSGWVPYKPVTVAQVNQLEWIQLSTQFAIELTVIRTTPNFVSMFPQSHPSSRIKSMVTSIVLNEQRVFHWQIVKDPLKFKKHKKLKMDNIAVQKVSSHVKNHFLSQVRQLTLYIVYRKNTIGRRTVLLLQLLSPWMDLRRMKLWSIKKPLIFMRIKIVWDHNFTSVKK